MMTDTRPDEAKEVVGKTIKSFQYSDRSIYIIFTDGTRLEIESFGVNINEEGNLSFDLYQE